MIDICPKKQPQVTPTQIKRQSYPWKIFKPRQLLFSTSPPSSFKFNSQNETQIFFEPLPLTLSLSRSSLSILIPEIKHYSLSYPNSLPSTIASSIFSLPQCSSPTYGVSSHSHYQASPVQRDRPLYPLKITFTLFLASPAVWRTQAIFSLADSEAQPPKRVIFPFYLFRFSTFSHLLFHFLLFFFTTTDGFFTYHNFI